MRFFLAAALLIAVAGCLVRISSTYGKSVRGDGTVTLDYDSYYHLRRAQWTSANYPGMLWSDYYSYYPEKGAIHWPPGYDFALGSLVKAMELAGFSQKEWELALCFLNPALAIITIMLVFLLAKKLFGPWAGLLAAAMLAWSPPHTVYSNFGNVDHHGAIALAVATIALLLLRCLEKPTLLGPILLGVFLGLCHLIHPAFIISSILLSLLFVTLSCLWALSKKVNEEHLLAFDRIFLSATCSTFLAVMTTPFGRSFALSYEMLSLLHYAAPLAGYFLTRSVVLLLAARQKRLSLAAAASWLASALLLSAILLATPAASCLAKGFSFAGQSLLAGESLSVFSLGAKKITSLFSPLFFALPLYVLFLLCSLRRNAASFAAVFYCAGTGAAGCLQYSFSPNAAVFTAVFSGGMAVFLAARAKLITGRPVAILVYAATASCGLFYLAPEYSRTVRLMEMDSLCRQLREISPETGGYLEPGVKPGYSVFTHWDFGNSVILRARLPVNLSNFGPLSFFMGHFADYARFELSTDPVQAREILRKYDAAYLITQPLGVGQLSYYAELLGMPVSDIFVSRGGRNVPLERFSMLMNTRLAQRDATPFSIKGRTVRGVPYLRLLHESEICLPAKLEGVEMPLPAFKLFQVVEGAVLWGKCAPGTLVTASLEILKNTGREFTYADYARAGSDGNWSIRFPYPTSADPRIRTVAMGKLLLSAAGNTTLMDLPEEAVLKGRTIFCKD